MSGWFGGYSAPSDYATSDMPEWVNMGATCLVSAFLLPFVAFLIVLPGVREKRLVTLFVFSLMLLIGASLSVSLYFPSWTVGASMAVVPFRAHTTERVLAVQGVNVGLTHLNITLRFERVVYEDALYGKDIDIEQLFYNEKFDLSSVSSMNDGLKRAFEQGLPYPILSVLEYFSLNQDSFDWGRHYRQAGHYAHAAVWMSISLWILSILFLLFLPHYFCSSLLLCGLSCVLSTLLYAIMSPSHLAIAFVGVNGERSDLEMTLGWAFWLILIVGIVACVVGCVLVTLQSTHVYTLSTFLDATLDETVSLKRRQREEESSLACHPQSSIQVMREHVKQSSADHDKSASSSGFESRNSYNASLRSSLDSFDDMPHSTTSTLPVGGDKDTRPLSVDTLSSEEQC